MVTPLVVCVSDSDVTPSHRLLMDIARVCHLESIVHGCGWEGLLVGCIGVSTHGLCQRLRLGLLLYE